MFVNVYFKMCLCPGSGLADTGVNVPQCHGVLLLTQMISRVPVPSAEARITARNNERDRFEFMGGSESVAGAFSQPLRGRQQPIYRRLSPGLGCRSMENIPKPLVGVNARQRQPRLLGRAVA